MQSKSFSIIIIIIIIKLFNFQKAKINRIYDSTPFLVGLETKKKLFELTAWKWNGENYKVIKNAKYLLNSRIQVCVVSSCYWHPNNSIPSLLAKSKETKTKSNALGPCTWIQFNRTINSKNKSLEFE